MQFGTGLIIMMVMIMKIDSLQYDNIGNTRTLKLLICAQCNSFIEYL